MNLTPPPYRRSRLFFLLGLLCVPCGGPLSAATPPPDKTSRPPNIVFILTDNQGAWTLGCYGNPDIRTPHLDTMAREGIRFTRAFSNNAVCSPTRATFLTGLTPSQHGVHRFLGTGGAQIGPGAYNTIEEFTSLPEVLANAGYVTGLSGKWHLGDNLHPQEGFTFWTTKPAGSSRGFLDQEVIEDGEIRIEPRHLTEYWTDRGIEFIDHHLGKYQTRSADSENRKSKTENQESPPPFFLLLAYNGPYSLSNAMKEPVPSPWSDPYRENPMKSFPRPEQIHPWQQNQHDLIGNIEAMRNLAGQVTAVDAGVGRIFAALRERGIDENTLVIFTADQGAVAGHAGFWGMGDHTRPLHGRDGTMHVPLLFRWPGRIKAGLVSERIVTNYDFMPTLLACLGHEMPQKQSPGRNYAPMLFGEAVDGWKDVVFFEFENVRAIRNRRWKYVERKGDDPARALYDLKADPDELVNLAGSGEHDGTEEKLRARLHAWFRRYADPRWDLWNGGTSKSSVSTWKQLGLPAAIREGKTP